MRHLLLVPLILVSALAAADIPAPVAAMQKTLAGLVDASAADAKVKVFAKDKLLPLINHAVLVKETQAQNAKKVSLDEIKRLDQEWQKAEEQTPLQKEKLGNACALAIKEIAKTLPAISETFAMDDQGANVGQNNLTSDYWQGDEDKWQKSFKEGKGGIDIGKAKFDKSANATIQQVSLPLVTDEGTVVGAITFGVMVERL